MKSLSFVLNGLVAGFENYFTMYIRFISRLSVGFHWSLTQFIILNYIIKNFSHMVVRRLLDGHSGTSL